MTGQQRCILNVADKNGTNTQTFFFKFRTAFFTYTCNSSALQRQEYSLICRLEDKNLKKKISRS